MVVLSMIEEFRILLNSIQVSVIDILTKMQVTHILFTWWHVVQKSHTLPFNAAQPNLVYHLSDVWESCHGGPHTNQQEQQLSNLPSGCASALQVSAVNAEGGC